MTKIFLSILFLNALFANPSKLKINVKNIQVGKGSIAVDIYDNDKNFFKKPISTKRVKATDQNLDFSFDTADGTYAVAVYQDMNDNKELDKGWFNIPKEPYGLSNNYRPIFSAPTFNDCKFKVIRQSTITITLK